MRWLMVVFAVLGLAACAPPQVPPSDQKVPPVLAANEYEMVAKQFRFEPAVITVVKDKPVTLYVTSVDVTHGLAIPAFQVNGRLEPGKVTVLAFTPDRTGLFEFRCSVFCGSGHREMLGAIEVVEQ